MIDGRRPLENLRPHFDKIYDSHIVGSGFFESDDYYRNEKERYWRSLELLCSLNLGTPARMLEIGGGQMSVLCKNLFSDECIVADISRQYVTSLQKSGIELITFNLMDSETNKLGREFDVVVLLEVIEHIPIPAYVLMERLKSLLAPNGVVFMTTRNLFRVRNLIRMFLGIEFLDRFSLPKPGESLGHQLEYSADHLRWQMERAGMQILLLREDSLGRTGHSVKARFARTLLAPLELRPIWRDGLVAAVRKPA